MQQVSSIEVKKYFILAHAIKAPIKAGKIISYEELMKRYTENFDKYNKYSERDLERLINGLELGKSLEELESGEKADLENQDRVKRYNTLSWSYGLVELNKMGAWPEMRGIDPRFTTGSIVDTVKSLKSYLSEKEAYNFSEERKNNLTALINLTRSFENIFKVDAFTSLNVRFPLILVPGDSIRGEAYKKWVMENHGDYHKHDTSLLGIDNGNVRALTYVFMGKEKAFSYVGKYKD